MRNHTKAILLSALLLLSIAGCSGQAAQGESSSPASIAPVQPAGVPEVSATPVIEAAPATPVIEAAPATPVIEAAPATTAGELTVHFGDDGAPFTLHLYDNSTAAAIAEHVGTADWRLPIYTYDGYDNWEVMQYYDLPSRYEIPQNAETITAEKTGEVFYSEPNRIVLFYGDAEVTGEYSRVGYFEATPEFVSAVQSNPVLEGWGNKIVLIKD